LAYRADEDSYEVLELHLVDATTYPPSAAQVVNDALAPGGDVGEEIAWSPDSTKLAFFADQDVDEEWELYVASVVDGVAQPAQKVNDELAMYGDVVSCDWCPDSTRIVYVAGKDEFDRLEAYVVDVTAVLPSAPERINGDLQSQESDIFEARWGDCPPE
jgi:Tol biopolymer transport system component